MIVLAENKGMVWLGLVSLYMSAGCTFIVVFRRFTMKKRGGRDQNGDVEETEITVYDYFVRIRKIDLSISADLPCINVGRPNRPTFIPIEVINQLALSCFVEDNELFCL